MVQELDINPITGKLDLLDVVSPLTEEQVEDIIGATIVGGNGATVTYDDGAGTITVDVDDDYVKLIGDSMSGDLDFSNTTGINSTTYVKFSDYDNDLPGVLTMGFLSESANQTVMWLGTQGGGTGSIELALGGATGKRFTFPDLTGTFALTGAGHDVNFRTLTISQDLANAISVTDGATNTFSVSTDTGTVLLNNQSLNLTNSLGTSAISVHNGTSTIFNIDSYNGTMTFNGAGAFTSESKQIIDITTDEAFLVRKNGDGGDLFKIDTTNSNAVLYGNLYLGNLAEENAISPLDIKNDDNKPWLDVDNFFSAQGVVTGAALQTNTTSTATQDRTISGWNYQITNSGDMGAYDLTIYGNTFTAEHNAIATATGQFNFIGFRTDMFFLDESFSSSADVNFVDFWGPSSSSDGTSGTIQQVSFAASENILLSTGKNLYLEGSYNGSTLTLGDTYVSYNSGTSNIDIYANGTNALNISSTDVNSIALMPITNNTYDIGSDALAWRDLYIDRYLYIKPTGNQPEHSIIDVDIDFAVVSGAADLMSFNGDIKTINTGITAVIRGINETLANSVTSQSGGFINLEGVRLTMTDAGATTGSGGRNHRGMIISAPTILFTGGSITTSFNAFECSTPAIYNFGGSGSHTAIGLNLGDFSSNAYGLTGKAINTGGGDVVFGGTAGNLKLGSSHWTANGTNTVTISNVAPSGVGTATISKWFTVIDNATGTTYYIPAWT